MPLDHKNNDDEQHLFKFSPHKQLRAHSEGWLIILIISMDVLAIHKLPLNITFLLTDGVRYISSLF
jgi:hypothetical protein